MQGPSREGRSGPCHEGTVSPPQTVTSSHEVPSIKWQSCGQRKALPSASGTHRPHTKVAVVGCHLHWRRGHRSGRYLKALCPRGRGGWMRARVLFLDFSPTANLSVKCGRANRLHLRGNSCVEKICFKSSTFHAKSFPNGCGPSGEAPKTPGESRG